MRWQNFALLRGPAGLNRVYVEVPAGSLQIDPWLENLKKGRTFATNGPLLGLSLGQFRLGDTLKIRKAGESVDFKAWLRSIVPIDHLELVCDGRVAKEFPLAGDKTSGEFTGSIPITSSGWCLLRAWSDKAEYPVLDIYPYATTSPIYLDLNGSKAASKEDAAYFVAWIDRLIANAEAHKDWNTDTEKQGRNWGAHKSARRLHQSAKMSTRGCEVECSDRLRLIVLRATVFAPNPKECVCGRYPNDSRRGPHPRV